jgi:hypothetical protein
MDYLKMIEFLVKEVAKKDDEIKSLSIALDSKSTLVDDLSKLSDERLEELVEMTTEKDHWKEEALDYRNDIEPKWWAKEKEYKAEIDELMKFKDKHKDSWATEFAYHHLKKAYDDNNSYYENRIAKLQLEINHLKHNK